MYAKQTKKKIQNKYVATLITLRVYKEDEKKAKKKENKGKSFSNEICIVYVNLDHIKL